MPRLTPCPSCHAHVMTHESSCPHCSAPLRTSAVKHAGAAALLGLALAGCPTDPGEPEYGVPDTTDTASSTTTATDSAGEAEYGVPDTGDGDGDATDSAAEPEYGVPETGDGDGDGG